MLSKQQLGELKKERRDVKINSLFSEISSHLDDNDSYLIRKPKKSSISDGLCKKLKEHEYFVEYIWKDCAHFKECRSRCFYKEGYCRCEASGYDSDPCNCDGYYCGHVCSESKCEKGMWMKISDPDTDSESDDSQSND